MLVIRDWPVDAPEYVAGGVSANGAHRAAVINQLPSMRATQEVEALRDRVRDFLLRLPPEGQLALARDLGKTLTRWEDWVRITGDWRSIC